MSLKVGMNSDWYFENGKKVNLRMKDIYVNWLENGQFRLKYPYKMANGKKIYVVRYFKTKESLDSNISRIIGYRGCSGQY